MVEIQHTPDRSSGQSFDTSGSFIARIGPLIPGACVSTPAEVHTLGSLDGGPPGIDPIAVRGHNMPRATIVATSATALTEANHTGRARVATAETFFPIPAGRI